MRYTQLLWAIFTISSNQLIAQLSSGSGDCEKHSSIYLFNVEECNRMDQDYVQIFEDNFDGSELNPSYWAKSYTLNGPISSTDRTKTWYKVDNVVVQDGHMKILTKEENLTNVQWWAGESDFRFTSGRVDSKFQFKYDYGKFEARVKIPKAEGTWPAFWLMSWSPDLWNEIDIFEFWENEQTKLRLSTHHDIPDDGNSKYWCTHTYTSSEEFFDAFHTYTVEWNPWYIRWWLDEVPLLTTYHFYDLDGHAMDCDDNSDWAVRSKVYPDRALNIVFNVDVHQDDFEPEANPIDFPCEMLVDWVKVYYKFPCQDVIINDCSTVNFQQNLFNVMYGKNIKFNCDYTLPAGYTVRIIGENIDLSRTNNMISPQNAVCELKPVAVNCGSSPSPLIGERSNMSEVIKLYPNPTHDSVYINYSDLTQTPTDYVIYNSVGRQVSAGMLGPTGGALNVAPLTTGSYFVRFYTFDGKVDQVCVLIKD